MNLRSKLLELWQKVFNRLVPQLLYFQKKYIMEQNILYNHELGISKEKYCNNDIIVSITTYGKRIYDVHLTIESIMEQTMKANRIILWLDYSFENKPLPNAIRLLQERGLEIMFCKDIRSYKKLIPALKAFPEDVIITFDDDVIYEFDLLEKFILSYKENPSFIYCGRMHKMQFDKKERLLPYSQWKWNQNEVEASLLNFPTGVGGILYPPHSLDDEVFNESVFMDICKYADDIWFKAMAIKNGTLTKKVYTHSSRGDDYLVNEEVQDIGLGKINITGKYLNNKQLTDVFSKYNLYGLLK